MFLPRIIPVLLLMDGGLVKTTRFRKPRYIGDPINAVRIFNDFEADELVFLDIVASKLKKSISLDLVTRIGEEAFMPTAVGGGISNIKTVETVLKAGAEKVVINTAIFPNLLFIEQISKYFGSQSIIASIDVKADLLGRIQAWSMGGSRNNKIDPIQLAIDVQNAGAGEILLTSINRDGTMTGYDVQVIHDVSTAVSIPVIACGGAGDLIHFKQAFDAGAHALAAGSFFVYHGNRNAVLINYPTKNELRKVLIND